MILRGNSVTLVILSLARPRKPWSLVEWKISLFAWVSRSLHKGSYQGSFPVVRFHHFGVESPDPPMVVTSNSLGISLDRLKKQAPP